jgi:hypothetical protein
MNKCLLLILVPLLLLSCKSKKVSLAVNDEQVNISDFLEFFQPLRLPYGVTDTVLRRKEPETAVIDYKLFARFVPDSVLTHLFGREAHPHLYAVGRIKVPKAETYVFIKGTLKDRRVLYVICFDKKDRFAAARPVLYSDNEPGVTSRMDMDGKYTITLLHEHKVAGQVIYHKDAYVFNEDTGLLLILTETNETRSRVPPVYDPIDTLPRKHKFSGDYAQDKRDLIAVRDGRDASRFLFFIHFEKEDGTCNGELKGEARFTGPATARYRASSDPCAIEFSFGSAGVSIKEIGGCGVHRDIKCFFEGYYERRRANKAEHGKTKARLGTKPA